MSYLFLIARRLLFKRRSSLITASMAVAAMIFLITFNDVVFSGVFSAVERDLTNFQYGDIVIQNEQQQFLDETDSSIMKQLARNTGVEALAPRIIVIAYEVNYRVGGQTSSVYRVLLTGVDTANLSGGQKDKFRNRKIGFIFQSYNLINELNAVENIMLPALIARTPGREARKKATSLLEAVGLGGKVNYPSLRLSGGEMQRVSIARALINEPSLVLADEPTGNLDSERTKDILRLLKRLNQENNQTFMVVTHDPMVVQTASKVIDILDGVVREVIHRTEFHCPYRTLVPHPGDEAAS